MATSWRISRSPVRRGGRTIFASAFAVLLAACSTKVQSSSSSALTGIEGGGAKHSEGGAAARDAGSAPKEAAAPPIDCVEAGRGTKRDSGFLPSIFTAHVGLESFCATFGCPYRDLGEFLAVHSCSPIEAGGYAPHTPRTVGCGLETIGGIALFGGTEYVFDAHSGALVGARIGSDAAFGPCNTGLYVAGVLHGSCASDRVYDCVEIP